MYVSRAGTKPFLHRAPGPVLIALALWALRRQVLAHAARPLLPFLGLSALLAGEVYGTGTAAMATICGRYAAAPARGAHVLAATVSVLLLFALSRSLRPELLPHSWAAHRWPAQPALPAQPGLRPAPALPVTAFRPAAPDALAAPLAPTVDEQPPAAADAALSTASAAPPAVAAAAERPPWQPPDVPRRPFVDSVEQWRPLVRDLLAEASDEGRLDGPAAGLDDDLVLALIEQESRGDPHARSWASAIGLMQVIPKTFAEMMLGDQNLVDAVDPDSMWDVPSNARAGIRYLALAMQTNQGNLYWALASYNAGVEVVERWRAVGLAAVPPMGGYVETAAYAQSILRRYAAHRPGLEVEMPAPMPSRDVPGAVHLLQEAGLWD